MAANPSDKKFFRSVHQEALTRENGKLEVRINFDFRREDLLNLQVAFMEVRCSGAFRELIKKSDQPILMYGEIFKLSSMEALPVRGKYRSLVDCSFPNRDGDVPFPLFEIPLFLNEFSKDLIQEGESIRLQLGLQHTGNFDGNVPNDYMKELATRRSAIVAFYEDKPTSNPGGDGEMEYEDVSSDDIREAEIVDFTK